MGVEVTYLLVVLSVTATFYSFHARKNTNAQISDLSRDFPFFFLLRSWVRLRFQVRLWCIRYSSFLLLLLIALHYSFQESPSASLHTPLFVQ